jgi:hypothetical protein
LKRSIHDVSPKSADVGASGRVDRLAFASFGTGGGSGGALFERAGGGAERLAGALLLGSTSGILSAHFGHFIVFPVPARSSGTFSLDSHDGQVMTTDMCILDSAGGLLGAFGDPL